MKLSLSRKPEAVAWTIEELLERVRDGEIRLPEFQRLFKWTPDDVVQLFDSILRGFPIGTFLFWKGASALASEGRAIELPFSPQRREATSLLFVLDGQQRLTSLAGVLLAPGDPDNERFRVAFDLDQDELIRVQEDEAWPVRAMPLFLALDSVEIVTWAQAQGLDAATQRRALEVGRAIREYRVPGYIVVAEAEETARLIFDRVNSSGKRLKKADVFKALHAGLATQEPNSLEGLQGSVADLGFGTLRENLVLQAAAAVAGLDVTKIDHRALSRPELGAALPPTAHALRRAVAFLRHDAHIPSVELLPFGFPLVALSRFFSLHPTPRPRSRELLARWVWRGAITQKHWTHEQAYLRESLGLLKGRDEEGEVQALLALLPRKPVVPALGEYNLKSAQTRLALLALLDLRPRDLSSGTPLDGAALISSERSAAVPLLANETSQEPRETAARESIFGRIIQRPMSPRRLRELLAGPHATDEVLSSLGLVRGEVEALLGGHAFAARRQDRLAQTFAEFFERRARWTESDRPSLESLVVEEASP